MRKLIILLAFIISSKVGAATAFKEGTVTSVKMFSDVVTIYVSTLPSACSTGQARVAIQKDNAIFVAVVSTALTAKATGSIVEIGYHQVCNNNSSSWDFESLWLK